MVHWHLVFYDIRDDGRRRLAHRLLRGYGRPIQYSVFRVRASSASIERLRWEVERILTEDDDILFVELPPNTVERIKVRNREGAWPLEDGRHAILQADDSSISGRSDPES